MYRYTRQMANLPGISHTYELVGDDGNETYDEDKANFQARRRRIPLLWQAELLFRSHPKAIFMALLLLAFLSYSLFTWPFWQIRKAASGCDSIDSGFQCQPDISHFWGQYSPYFTLPSDISTDTPAGCEINLVQVLSRHGARDPTRKKTDMYSALMKRIHAEVSPFDGKYAFLKDYQYTLGADELTKLGQRHMKNSGIKFYQRYKDLAWNNRPFVRASGQQRVVDSAHFFEHGYREACRNEVGDTTAKCYKVPYPYVQISEEEGSHNPLDHSLCDAFEIDHQSGVTSKGQEAWQDVFAPKITARLNEDLPGAKLDDDETIMIMDLCPFETVARSDDQLSPFCNLFKLEEWQQYDYYQTIGKYYAFASYDHLGPTQGVGFTNELIARLTGKPVVDRTSVDHDLDGNEKTFPIGEKWKIYADFSHDNDMVAIMAAMGLFNDTKPLSTTAVQNATETNGFSTSWLVPFGARIYFERMTCAVSEDSKEREFVRVIVNDRVQPMNSCNGDNLGRCTLSAFVESLEFARTGGRWDECFP